MDEQRGADRAEAGAQLLVERVAAAHEPDRDQPPAGRDLGVDDVQARLSGRRQRLLAQHALAGRDAREHELLVRGVVGGDDHRVDLGIGDQGVRVGVRAPAADRGRGRGAGRVGVGDRRDVRAVDRRRQRAHMVRAHHPRADHADADGLDGAHVAVGKCMWDGSRASSGQRLVTTLPRV
jgi:hypothetical protein